MRVTFITFLFTIVFQFSNAAFDKTLLRGEWLNTKVILAKDSSFTPGKYTENGHYLKFRFTKLNELFITTAPFDQNVPLLFSINDNVIDFILNPTVILLSESKYIINELDSTHLVLLTKNEDKDLIIYFFDRIAAREDRSLTIEFTPSIILKKINYTNGLDNVSCIYNFRSNEYDYVTPVCINYPILGKLLAISIGSEFPKNYPKEILSEEIKIKLEINEKGKVIKTELLKGQGGPITATILKCLSKSKWKPVEINGTKRSSILVFNIQTLLVEDSFY